MAPCQPAPSPPPNNIGEVLIDGIYGKYSTSTVNLVNTGGGPVVIKNVYMSDASTYTGTAAIVQLGSWSSVLIDGIFSRGRIDINRIRS